MAKADLPPEVDANVKPAFFCPRNNCCRAGDDLGRCGSHRTKCPPPQLMVPGKHVMISCSTCNKTFGIKAEDIVKGRPLARCSTDKCGAMISQPPKPPASMTRPKPPKKFGQSSEGAPDPIQQNLARSAKLVAEMKRLGFTVTQPAPKK